MDGRKSIPCTISIAIYAVLLYLVGLSAFNLTVAGQTYTKHSHPDCARQTSGWLLGNGVLFCASACLLFARYRALLAGTRAKAVHKLSAVYSLAALGWWMLGVAWYEETQSLGCNALSRRTMLINIVVPAVNITLGACAVAVAGCALGWVRCNPFKQREQAAATVSPQRPKRMYLPAVPGDELGDDACWIPTAPPEPVQQPAAPPLSPHTGMQTSNGSDKV